MQKPDLKLGNVNAEPWPPDRRDARYILDDTGRPVVEADHAQAHVWYCQNADRINRRDELKHRNDEVIADTVFLTNPERFPGMGIAFWLTRISGGVHDNFVSYQFTQRDAYATYEEAYAKAKIAFDAKWSDRWRRS